MYKKIENNTVPEANKNQPKKQWITPAHEVVQVSAIRATVQLTKLDPLGSV